MDLSRRSFLKGLATAFGAVLAAPAIVRAASLMPVKPVPLEVPPGLPIDAEWSQDGLLWRPYATGKLRSLGRSVRLEVPTGNGLVRMTSRLNGEQLVVPAHQGTKQSVLWHGWRAEAMEPDATV
jgi:hypothetical protein